MVFLTIILVLIICFLLIYIFKINKEIKKIDSQISNNQKCINISLFNKNINKLVNSINIKLLKDREELIENKKKLDEIEDTILNISHDIRTPITGISGYIQLLNKTEIDEKQESYINSALLKITTLEKLIEDFYQLSYININSKEKIELEEININDILVDTILNKTIQFEKNNIEIFTEFLDEYIIVLGNKNMINRVLGNIIDNAVYHGRDNLTIKIEEDNKYINLIFENNIDKEDDINIELIFNKFYKADKSRNTSSSGLGLSIIKKFMEELNGKVYVKVEDNKFKIKISFLKK